MLLLAQSTGAYAQSGASDVAPSGGVLTHNLRNREAFAQPAPTLSAAQFRAFNSGNRLFNTNWVVAPASVDNLDGLGPLFNRVSCSGCHLRDGRGRPPVGAEQEFLSMLIRWSVPGRGTHGEPREVPGYGGQLNDRAIAGVAPEARARVRWVEQSGVYADGTPYSLRAPRYRFSEAAYGRLPANLQVSGRVAPTVIGLGLLEAVSADEILALADPHDRNGDGISGRPNWVHDPVSGTRALGRFGWKAGTPNLLVQNASAALGDIGITTRWFPKENCSRQQRACKHAPNGGAPELADAQLELLTQYLRFLAVPAQRDASDPAVRRGERVFTTLGCADCHRPGLRTRADAEPQLLADQHFRPYTDLLLHDLGAGLSDQRPEFAARGSEWRTAPLWGIGLVLAVNDHQFLLHDGRARGVSEAILWHAGEAVRARDGFVRLARSERDDLLAFVNSL